MLKTFVATNTPFSVVEHLEFENLIQLLRDDAELPSRKRLRYLLDRCYNAVQGELLPGLGEHTKVSIALDCWMSPNNLSFLGVTCYYISESWEYKEVLIGFEPIEGSHTGENLGYAVNDILPQHNLTHRLLAITADNASNNGTLRRSLESWLETQQLTWDAESMKINCLAHVFHLSAKVLLEGIQLYNNDSDDDDYDVGPTLSESDSNLQVAAGVASTVHKVS